MTHFDIQFTWSKIKVKLFVFVQMLFAPYFVTPFQESCQTRYSPSNVLLSHFCVRSPFAHRPFTVHSACAHPALVVPSFAFSVHCSLAFTVHKAFTVRSPSVHLSFTKRSSFIQRSVSIVIRNSEVERSVSRSWNEIVIKR